MPIRSTSKSKVIFLDSYPTSLLCKKRGKVLTDESERIFQWSLRCFAAGHAIVIPEIVDYELRRELLRARKHASVNRLDNLKASCTYLPLSTAAMVTAAELWTQARQQGSSTAHDENIDVDVILAAQALTCGEPPSSIVVATANLRHLSKFANAALWYNITP